MKGNTWFINMAASICMVAVHGVAFASDAALNFAAPSSSYYTGDIRSYVLASADSDTALGQSKLAASVAPAEFEPPLWTTSNAHKYLGLGTLAMVVATVLAPKPGECEKGPCPAVVDTSGPHKTFGQAAATLAAATAVSGFMFHWNDIHMEDGWTDPDNLHALLGTAGALLMMAAVNSAPAGGHAGEGMLGGIAMGAAIKITW